MLAFASDNLVMTVGGEIYEVVLHLIVSQNNDSVYRTHIKDIVMANDFMNDSGTLNSRTSSVFRFQRKRLPASLPYSPLLYSANQTKPGSTSIAETDQRWVSGGESM